MSFTVRFLGYLKVDQLTNEVSYSTGNRNFLVYTSICVFYKMGERSKTL